MVLISFQIENKLEKAQYFQETFLLANIGLEMVLKMPFATVSNSDVLFLEQKLT